VFRTSPVLVQHPREARRRVHGDLPFGLWNEASRRPLYRAASGQPLFGDDVQDEQDTWWLRRARDWFQEHVSDDDEVYVKLNCKGSECDILDDLLDSNEIRKVQVGR
jgi:hypothetical protein